MTPCEKLGYKVGDRFEVVEVDDKRDPIFYEGSIIELIRDDGSQNPQFKLVEGEHSRYMLSNEYTEHYYGLSKVRPLKPEWKGGLPPVGAECTATLHGGAHEFDIRVTYSVKEVVCGEIINPAHGFKSGTIYPFDTLIYSFKPLRTERDKAIDDMAEAAAITPTTAVRNLLGALYDAGYRKP